MILHLGRTTAPDAGERRLAEQIAGLGWYARAYEGRLAFPGHQMMRLSMDLAKAPPHPARRARPLRRGQI